MERDFYLVAYDVHAPARLRAVRREVTGHATGGQKSVAECFLAAAERGDLVARLRGRIDPKLDRVHLVRLFLGDTVWVFGTARPPQPPQFYFVGTTPAGQL